MNEKELSEKRFAALLKDFPQTRGNLRFFSAPGRTELGGNHTDHNRGRVIAAAIQLDIAAVAALRTDNRIFFRSTGHHDVIVDLTDTEGRPDLKPKNHERGTTEALIRGIAAEFTARGVTVKGFNVNADSMVLSGSGLSSSAAVEVLFGRIINNLFNEKKCGSLELAQISQKAENVYFGKPCGLMDQIACAYGGAVAVDFENPAKPLVKKVSADFSAAGFSLCMVNTRGSHADLTADYAAIPGEMKAVAALFGKEALREVDRREVEERAAEIRKKLGDRALLRAFHFFDENRRALEMLAALETPAHNPSKQEAMSQYLQLVNESGDSSWELLQNIYSPHNVKEQGIAVALALTKEFLRSESLAGACRIHGGGFAGAIQTYIPVPAMEHYRALMDNIFGAVGSADSSVTELRIRSMGAEEVEF